MNILIAEADRAYHHFLRKSIERISFGKKRPKTHSCYTAEECLNALTPDTNFIVLNYFDLPETKKDSAFFSGLRSRCPNCKLIIILSGSAQRQIDKMIRFFREANLQVFENFILKHNHPPPVVVELLHQAIGRK